MTSERVILSRVCSFNFFKYYWKNMKSRFIWEKFGIFGQNIWLKPYFYIFYLEDYSHCVRHKLNKVFTFICIDRWHWFLNQSFSFSTDMACNWNIFFQVYHIVLVGFIYGVNEVTPLKVSYFEKEFLTSSVYYKIAGSYLW